MKHFLKLLAIPPDDVKALIADAARLKASHRLGIPTRSLAGKVIALIFEKPSMRTRVSFETAIAHLGGTALFLPGNEVGLGWRETHADFARTMSRFVDAMVLRVFSQDTVDKMAEFGQVPIINGLSDRSHPCQAVADLLTIQEACGSIADRTVVFVGDGNNVSMSLAVGCARLGAKFVLTCPNGYEFDDLFRTRYEEVIGRPLPAAVHDPDVAVREADVIYTDVWTSMGQEAEREERLHKFAPYQVSAKLLAEAPPGCKVLHCLPAHRGEEITDEIVDGPASLVFDQAENRLHAQKAILEWVMGVPRE